MPLEKQKVRSLIKAVVVSSIFAGIFSITWMLENNVEAANRSDATNLDSGFVEWMAGEPVPEDTAAQILSLIKQVRPDLSIADVRFSHMEGLYKASLQGNVIFFNADGGLFIVGEMYQIENNQLVNLQEEEHRRAEAAFSPQRAKMLDLVNKEDMVIFHAKGDAKAHVYVFTDIDCGFCRKLHRQMPEMQSQGIEVRYLGFPRAGVNSKSAQKLVTTWCADDPKKTMTQFKQGENLALKTCEPNPIADHYMLGQKMGVRGTPAIVLSSGQMVPGAVSTQQLITILKEANLYH